MNGYNSESLEWFHIDFTKAAYHASNKQDYLEQMAVWLQRQEAMWMKDSYLMWVNHHLPGLLKNAAMDDGSVDKADIGLEDVDVDEAAAVTGCDRPTNSTLSPQIWQVAKTPPYQNMSAEQLGTQFGAEDFIAQLTVYLNSCSPFPPNSNDRFNAYHQVKIVLPPNRYINNLMRTHWIRTTPAVFRKGRWHESSGHFDVPLVVVDKIKYREGKGFDGCFFYLHKGLLNKL